MRYPGAAAWARRLLLARAVLVLLAVLPARTARAAPPLLEADALVVRFAPAREGPAIRARRVAWIDSSRSISIGDLEGSLRPVKTTGRRSLLLRARTLAAGTAARPMQDVALSGTLVDSSAGKPWVLSDALLRIGGRDVLSGSITGPLRPPPGATSARGVAARIDLASREPLDLATLAPALAWAGAAGWRASGMATLRLSARLPAGAGQPIDARADVGLRGAGFSSPGDVPDLAADKLGGRVIFRARGTLRPRRIRFDLEVGASDFEFLSGVYYTNLAGRTVRLQASGWLRGTRIEQLDALLAAPELGSIRMTGAMGIGGARPGDAIRAQAQGVDLARLWPLAVSEPLGDAHRWIKGSTMRGTARLEARWTRSRSGWTIEGDAEAKGLRWQRPGGTALFDVPEARLPFHFRFPSPGIVPDARTVDSSRYGKIRLARFRAGSWAGGEVLVEPLLQEGGLRLRRPVVIPFYGGALRVEDLEGSDLLEPGRRIRFHGRVEGVDVSAFTRGLGLPEFHGRLDGAIPEVRIDGDHLRAPGRFETTVFGGRVVVSGLEATGLFSGLPRIGLDVSGRGLSLEQATEALSLGRMSGILEGSIRGLVIERGEPQAFFSDFQVVDRKGVPRWVSADFVEDVATLFGSGNAVSETLNRGVNRFIRRYRYEEFGFTCRLRNDVFYPQGKIHRDGVEYLMWGRWNYVRIAVRNPGRGIPFSFMVRQVRAIAASSGRVEQRNRTPLNWLWPPSWRAPRGRPGPP